MSLPALVEEKILVAFPEADIETARANYAKAITALNKRPRYISHEARQKTLELENLKKSSPEKYKEVENRMVLAEISRRLKNGSIVKGDHKFNMVSNDDCGVHQIDECVSKLCGYGTRPITE